MDYTILVADTPSDLSSQISNLSRNGWQTDGGITVAIAHDPKEDRMLEVWAQLMSKASDAK